jgi:stringent starvation protein B
MPSVLGIYARETGQGMIFSHDADSGDEGDRQDKRMGTEASPEDIDATRARSHLRIIK